MLPIFSPAIRRVRGQWRAMVIGCLIFCLPLFAVPRQIVQQIIAQIDDARLNRYMRELSGDMPVTLNGAVDTISTRCVGFSGNTLAMEYIKMKLSEFGLTPIEQEIGTTGYKNVYAEMIGYQYPDQRYVICAHFDDRPNASIAPGADDNASGVAATLEAARVLSSYSLPYTVVFGFWNYEEYGLIGSQAYAAMAKARNDQIAAVINIDMIGWDGNGDKKYNAFTNGGQASTDICTRMNRVALDYQLNLNQFLVTSTSACSDHYSFWQQGYPAMLLIEDYYQHGDFNPYYHTAQDRFSQLHLDYFHAMCRLAIATLADYLTDAPLYQLATVWPGDINYDTVVDERDLAPITRYWGQIGSARQGATVQWNGQMATLWSTAEATFADANGDGFINHWDVLPIGLHWGRTHTPWRSEAVPLRKNTLATPMLFPHPEAADGIPHQAGAEWTLLIDAGDAIDPVHHLFGCAFILDYSLSIDKIEVIAATATNLLGDDLICFVQNDGILGQLALAITMKNGSTPFSGYGVLMHITCRNKTDLNGYNDLHLATRDAYANDDLGYSVPIRGTGYPLPVTMVAFNVRPQPPHVLLTWEIQHAAKLLAFFIERKQDNGQFWQTLAQIPYVDGNDHYQYVDVSALSGRYDYRLKILGLDGEVSYSETIDIEVPVPLAVTLQPNYPNPFNSTTTIAFTLAEPDFATIKIYNLAGRECRSLAAAFFSSGWHQLCWDGKDDNGNTAPTGTYIYTLETTTGKVMKRMTMIK